MKSETPYFSWGAFSVLRRSPKGDLRVLPERMIENWRKVGRFTERNLWDSYVQEILSR